MRVPVRSGTTLLSHASRFSACTHSLTHSLTSSRLSANAASSRAPPSILISPSNPLMIVCLNPL